MIELVVCLVGVAGLSVHRPYMCSTVKSSEESGSGDALGWLPLCLRKAPDSPSVCLHGTGQGTLWFCRAVLDCSSYHWQVLQDSSTGTGSGVDFAD